MDLLKAVELQPLEKIKELVAIQGIPIDSSEVDYAALNSSIKLGRKDVAMFLIKKRCRANRVPKLGILSTIKHASTPLHNAVKLGDVELVDTLLNRNASMTNVDSHGNSPLHLSFTLGYIEITSHILDFIEKTATFTNTKNIHGLSHFHIACTSNSTNLVLRYMNNRSNLGDSVSSSSPHYPGYTAIQFAVEFKSPLNLKLILEHSKGYLENQIQATLERAKASLGSLSVMVDLLISYSQPYSQGKVSQFHIACLQDNPALVNTFLSNGAAVNSAVSEEAVFCPQYTPLHYAIESNCKENVKLLLQHGAQVNLANADFMTPLHLALYNGNHEILDLIYESTRNKVIECDDCNGLNYFHVAVAKNDTAAVKQFLANKDINVNARVQHNHRNFSGYTALHFAVRFGHLNMAILLIHHGADIQASDMEQHGTPLHMAVSDGHCGFMNLFLRNNARVDVSRPWDSKNLLHLLVQSYNGNGKRQKLLDYIKKLVFDHGLDINAKDYDGYTPLHYACAKISVGAPCAKILLEYGADINIENKMLDTPFDVTFYDVYRNNAEDYMLLYNHVKGLKTLGLTVNPKNDECCLKLLNEKAECQEGADCFRTGHLHAKQQQMTLEVRRLEKVHISRKTSLHDFIIKDENQLLHFTVKDTLPRLMSSPSFAHSFLNFGYLVKLRWHKILKLKSDITPGDAQ